MVSLGKFERLAGVREYGGSPASQKSLMEIESLGLINHACEEADLQPRADTFAQRLANLNPAELSFSKSLFYKTDDFRSGKRA